MKSPPDKLAGSLYQQGQTTALASVADEPVAERPATDNPLAMLHMALASGTDPDKLGKLMDLAERWKGERAAEEYAVAMNAAQKDMPCVVKDATNAHTKSTYARLETVHTAIKPVYSRHGFSLSYGTDETKLADHIRIVCDVSHTGGHTRRYHLDCPLDGAGFKGTSNKTGIQAIGSTVSYGRRYLALMIFNVTVADQDIDGNRADALDAITEAEALQIEDLLTDKQVNRKKFFEWCKQAGYLVADEELVGNIAARHYATIVDTLQRKKTPEGR